MLFRTPKSEKKFPAEIDNLRANNNFLRLIVFCLTLLLMVCSMGWYKSLGAERIILVPPEIHKTMWVDKEEVSNEYLEEMANYISFLELAVTPETVKYQNEQLLKYAAPEERGALKLKMDEAAAKIIAYGASTVFHQTAISFGTGKDALKVVLTGSMSTFIADKRVSEGSKTYLVVFAYRNGKIFLKDFKEVNQNDPFNENIKLDGSQSFEVPRQ